MTVIRPNSISGINSITANGGDINLFRADGTKADVPIVNNITAGVVTATKFVGPIEGNLSNGTINATSGTITGNLGVGGVLTYEDVTNIDSIGIITARAGINVSGGTITGDGSGLTGVGLGTDGSANTSGIITATAFVPTTGQLSHRNIIVNGAMTVAQRGSSSTSTGYQTVDRFQFLTNTVDEAPTQAQVDVASGTTPYTLGFRKALKITNGNQTSVGAADAIYVRYRPEAQDIAGSGWNYTSTSSFITLSFWVKSSVAQNFFGVIETSDGTQKMFPFQTGSLSADTWTKVTITIPGHADLAFNFDNGQGLGINWVQFMGTDYTANSAVVDTWKAQSDTERMPDNTSTWYTTNDATFEITGVQLEVGPVATPFEHRSYADELRRCQRYFFGHSGANINGSNSSTPDSHLGTCSCMSTSGISFNVVLPVPMRTVPTLYSTVTGSTRYRVNSAGANVNSGSDPVIYVAGSTHILVSHDLSGFGGLQSGQSGNIRRYQGSGVLGYSAELQETNMGIQFDGINNEIKSQTKIDFPGSIGIAGTLTYEDVTNVDSIGVITARSGIDVTGGTITGDGSGLTGISGFSTALSNTQGTLENLIFKTTESFTVGAGQSIRIESDNMSGNTAFTRLSRINVATGATFHVSAGTTFIMNVLSVF